MKTFVWTLLAMLPLSAGAEIAYVTDMLQLDMYAGSDMAGSPIKRLRSGDKLEIVERNGRYARVKSGSQTGWVKSLYLVEQEPARTRVNQLEKTNEQLEGSVKTLRAQVTAEQDRIKQLTAAQNGEVADRETAEAELVRLRAENERLGNRLDSYAGSLPLTWVLIAVLISLVGGGIGGWYYIDKRSRDKHGGYRVY